jgi:hypothetical protein
MKPPRTGTTDVPSVAQLKIRLHEAAFYQARYIEHVGSGIEDVEVERDPGWDEYFTSNHSTEESIACGKGLAEIANQWKDDAA